MINEYLRKILDGKYTGYNAILEGVSLIFVGGGLWGALHGLWWQAIIMEVIGLAMLILDLTVFYEEK